LSGIASLRTLLLAVFLSGGVQAQAADPPFVVSIPTTSKTSQLAFRDASSHFHVVLQNRSTSPQRAWEWWSSWGWPTLSFELSDASGKHWIANRRKDMAWSRNSPIFLTIEPGNLAVIDVYFGDAKIWEGFPLVKGQYQEVQMKAIFEVRETPESKERQVWTGRIESEPISVTFVKWR